MKHVEIENQTQGGIAILNVMGFMDMREVPKFEEALDTLIKSGKSKIVLDLTRLEYISSAGLGAIIGSIREVRRLGGDIKVGGYSAPVFDILKTFGFIEVFETYSTCDEAIHKFKG